MAIVEDTFVEASADTALTSHAPTGANAGTGWTEEANTESNVFEVKFAADNLGVTGTVSNGHIVASLQPNPSTAEQDVELLGVTMGGGDNHTFCIGRQTAALTFYLAGGGDSANQFYLGRLNAGTYVDLGGATTEEWDAAETCKLEIRDAAKKGYLNGTEILSSTDNTITSSGKWGIAIGNLQDSGGDWLSSQLVDSFVGTEVGGGGPTTYEDSLSLTVSLVAAMGLLATYEPLISLAAKFTMSVNADTVFEDSISLPAKFAMSTNGGLAFETAMTLAAKYGISLDNAVAFNPSIQLDSKFPFAVASDATYETDLTLPAAFTSAFLSDATFEPSLIFPIALSLSSNGGQAFEIAVTLASKFAMAAQANITFEDVITLANQLTMDSTEQLTMAEAVTFALDLVITLASDGGTSTYEDVMNLAIELGMSAVGEGGTAVAAGGIYIPKFRRRMR